MSLSVEPLRSLLGQLWPTAAVTHITPMAGGMSSRRFFRAGLENVSPDASSRPSSVVGVYTPDVSKSDEVSHAPGKPNGEWPFLEIQRLLANAGVRVPRVFGANEHGWMVVEDLGDCTLARALLERPEQKEGLYRIAVRDLAMAHRALATLPSDCVVASRHFDERLLHWEIEHFRQYALLARNIVPTPRQAERYAALATALATYVAGLPTGFVHRDYQSRNLMWLPAPPDETQSSATLPRGELVWIDFQDALIGPRVYDLVALLNDSYQQFTRPFVEERLREYAHFRAPEGVSEEAVFSEFDAVTVQRKLKDAGRFVFFHVKNGDDSYLQFVEPTIDKIKASSKRLAHLELFREWTALLDELVP